MKQVLTAIGNSMLNSRLKENSDWKVLADDISTDEELIEYLERTEDIEILFLCSKIIKNYEINEFIDIVRKIQRDIFIIFFKEDGINENIEDDERLEIYNQLDVDLKQFEKLFQTQNNENDSKNEAKIISISGVNGVGKSTFSTLIAQNVENKNIKTLLIDFDLDENQIRTILKIKKQPEYNGNIENLIINFKKNLDILCHLDIVFQNKKEIDYFKIQEILNKFKKEYDLILIDTSSKLENEYTKRIFYNSDKIIFLLDPNIIGVKKSKNLLEVLENDWKIQPSQINLILNKVNIYQISDAVIEEIFSDMKVVGKIKYRDTYNLMINKNILKKEIKKEYERIYKKIYG